MNLATALLLTILVVAGIGLAVIAVALVFFGLFMLFLAIAAACLDPQELQQ
jgi:hypothetical protein